MINKKNFTILILIFVFGLIFVPRIINRIEKNDVIRKGSRSSDIGFYEKNLEPLPYILIDNKRKKVPAFEFTNQNGEIISNSDYLGKVYIVEFFFTTCTTICPVMNTNLVHIQNSFEKFTEFGIASFSINPEYDTVEVLSQYAKDNGIVNPNWNLMTGNRSDIYKLANDGFLMPALAGPEFDDGFAHSGFFALIDKEGYIRCRNAQFDNPQIYYRGSVNFQEKLDSNGESEQITILKEDILKLLSE